MGQLIDTEGPSVSLWAAGVKGGLMPRSKSIILYVHSVWVHMKLILSDLSEP